MQRKDIYIAAAPAEATAAAEEAAEAEGTATPSMSQKLLKLPFIYEGMVSQV